MTGNVLEKDGAHDFDFLTGSWKVHNRRLRERLKGSKDWVEFEATSVARPLLGGIGNEDEYRTDYWPGFTGMSFRFFNVATKQWAISWADSRHGTLEPPVIGTFSGDRGVFEGKDVFEGRPILVRFTWSRVATPTPRWEQAFSEDGGKSWETNWVMDLKRLEGFQVVELRRYTTKAGARDHFARRFESFFPEAFQQLGALALGQFAVRGNPVGFTWLRGFEDMEARAAVNAAFYYGPVWKEHRSRMNDLLVDSDDVLLLRPLTPERGVLVLPAPDPVDEPEGARGVVVAQVFSVQEKRVEELARRAKSMFESYRAAGVREAGVLVTIDLPNNFPQLPVRTDGPYLVWLGIVKDDRSFRERFQGLEVAASRSLQATGLLRRAPELLVLDPTSRSRLRWPREWVE